MTQPDTISVFVELEREVFADRARLRVEVRGDSRISGGQALAQAREVRDLVEALGSCGVDQSAIQLKGVTARVSSGLTGKSSSAAYQLHINIDRLDELADVIGVITSRKNASMDHVEWRYGDAEAIHDAMLTEALAKSKVRAELVCREMGLKNLGVLALADAFGDYWRLPVFAGVGHDTISAVAMRQASAGLASDDVALCRLATDDLGLKVTHSATKYLTLMVLFRVEAVPG